MMTQVILHELQGVQIFMRVRKLYIHCEINPFNATETNIHALYCKLVCKAHFAV